MYAQHSTTQHLMSLLSSLSMIQPSYRARHDSASTSRYHPQSRYPFLLANTQMKKKQLANDKKLQHLHAVHQLQKSGYKRTPIYTPPVTGRVALGMIRCPIRILVSYSSPARFFSIFILYNPCYQSNSCLLTANQKRNT